MKKMTLPFIAFIVLMLSSCSGGLTMPKVFWDNKEGGSSHSSKVEKAIEKREALVVPPELRGEIELPAADEVASQHDPALLSEKYKQAVAGKHVALDARVYPVTADKVFSAVVDGMTSLNLPVQSVDSRSGIVTTDWVRKGSHSSVSGMLGGMVGMGGPGPTQHRFVVRVFRIKMGEKVMSKLEVRVLLQSFIARHWVNKRANKKIALELFSAVEEQLTRMKGTAPLSDGPTPLR